MPMTAEEVVRFNERCAVARAESERQYQVELAKIEAIEKIEQAQIKAMEFAESKSIAFICIICIRN